MLKRIYAVFVARNREFMRDRGTLAWNILMPVILVFGLAFVFGGEGRNQYTVGVLQASSEIDAGQHPFLQSRFIEFVPVADEADGFRKVARHRLDLLVRFGNEGRYWVNPESPAGYFAERLLLQSAHAGPDPLGRPYLPSRASPPSARTPGSNPGSASPHAASAAR